MAEVNTKAELIKLHKNYNTILYKMGYLSPLLNRELRMFDEFIDLINNEVPRMQAYNIVASSNGLGTTRTRQIIKRFENKF